MLAEETNLRGQIEDFASQYLPLSPVFVRLPKVIHDALWGTIRLQKNEISLLDTPLMQRLRHIKQNGFAYLTYPSTTHTRFEHSIGVMHHAG